MHFALLIELFIYNNPEMNNFICSTCILILTMFIVFPAQEVQAQERRVAAVKRRKAQRTVTRRVVRRTTRRAITRHYHGRPRLGLVVSAVPKSARVIRSGSRIYYLDRGIYYVTRGNRFVVVRPAVGLRIRTLPQGFVRTIVRGTTYFYYYGSFYTLVEDGADEYQVVAPPTGALVDALPEGYEAVVVAGKPYLVVGDTYYESVATDQFNDGYGYRVDEL